MALIKPDPLLIPFCNSGTKSAPPLAANLNVANQETGYPLNQQKKLSVGGVAVKRSETNGLFNFYSNYILWQQAGGVPTFEQTISDKHTGYPAGIILFAASNRTFQLSLKDNNIANFITTPSFLNDGLNWKKVAGDTAADFPDITDVNGLVSITGIDSDNIGLKITAGMTQPQAGFNSLLTLSDIEITISDQLNKPLGAAALQSRNKVSGNSGIVFTEISLDGSRTFSSLQCSTNNVTQYALIVNNDIRPTINVGGSGSVDSIPLANDIVVGKNLPLMQHITGPAILPAGAQCEFNCVSYTGVFPTTLTHIAGVISWVGTIPVGGVFSFTVDIGPTGLNIVSAAATSYCGGSASVSYPVAGLKSQTSMVAIDAGSTILSVTVTNTDTIPIVNPQVGISLNFK